jgi:steroid 5-alpha reductase family enzyme
VFLVGFPLLIVALAVYNMIAFLTPPADGWATKIYTVSLLSGVDWSVTFGDAMIAGALFLLFIEVVKATGAKSVVDHILSLLVFGAAVAEFLLVQQAANATFAILVVICFVDVIAGLSIRFRVSRRERDLAEDFERARVRAAEAAEH